MKIYSDEKTQNYTALRDDFAWTDSKSFELLEEIGIGGKKIFDFGCGDGRYASRFSERGAKEVVGIDVSPAMIARAKERLRQQPNQKLRFVEGDANALPFEDKTFDVVFSNFVLVHFPDTLGALKEISRVLSPGGYLLATFGTFDVSDEKLFNTEIPLLLGSKESVLVEDLVKSDDEFKINFEKAGFDVVYYKDQKHPFLKIAPFYNDLQKIEKVKTIVCLVKKK